MKCGQEYFLTKAYNHHIIIFVITDFEKVFVEDNFIKIVTENHNINDTNTHTHTHKRIDSFKVNSRRLDPNLSGV